MSLFTARTTAVPMQTVVWQEQCKIVAFIWSITHFLPVYFRITLVRRVMSQCTARTTAVPMEAAVWPSFPAETTPVTVPWDGQENYAQHVRYEHIQGLSQDFQTRCPKFVIVKIMGVLFSRVTTVYSDNRHKHVFTY